MIDAYRVITAGDPLSGDGYIAGEPPPTPNPYNLDGRTKVLGEIKPLRVTVLDGVTKRIVAQTFSAANGTWRINGLSPDHSFTVLFDNPGGYYKVLVGAVMQPVNGFVQDFVYAQPYPEP